MKRKKASKKKAIKNADTRSELLLFRYLILLGLMFTLPLIYKILTPLTVYSTAFLLNLLYDVSFSADKIFIFPKLIIQIIPACVAGSAYLLLLILNLTVPMKIKKRIYSVLFSMFLLFIINVLRIFILSILLVSEYKFFDFTHKLFWYVLSTIFVVGIWFLTAYLFKIREIPVYTDLKYLIRNIKKR